MRNIKRAFSMALALVMLMGMMLVPSAAAGFSDQAEIVNKEAVAITAGLGLFAGADGKFMPQGTVTRAQMATIIVKMLNGSDVNADSFKGTGKFTDTADFEGGWAEGYINWCSTLGVVAGYGDGTFKPGKAVTTAEAVTMILNALKVDAGQGTWPVTVMAKSEEIKLFADLATKPGSDVALTRDQLAVITLNGLTYSPEGANSYVVGDKKFDSAMDAYLYAQSVGGTVETTSGKDSLAGSIFEIKTATGVITGNKITGEDGTVLSDGKIFAIDTDVADLGRYVTVYYKETYQSDEEPGLTYAIVDEAKYVTVTEEVDTAKQYKAAFTKNVALAASGWYFDGTCTGEYMEDTFAVEGYVPGESAPEGTYVIFEGKVTGYIAPATVGAARVTVVNKRADNEYIMLSGVQGQLANTEGDDMVEEYDGIAVDDFVTYISVQGRYILTKMDKVSGVVSRQTVDEDGRIVITVDGKQYTDFGNDNNAFADEKGMCTLTDDAANLDYGQTYTFHTAPDGTVVCYEQSGGAGFSVENTVFLLGSINLVERDTYGNYNKNNYARGVDMNGDEVMLLLGRTTKTDKNGNGGTETVGSTAEVAQGYYTYKASTDRDEKEFDIQKLTAFNTNSRSGEPYVMVYSSGIDWNFTGSMTTGGRTYGKNSETRYMVLDDAGITDAEPIAATLSTGSCSVWLSQGQKMYAIVSQQANGTLVMQVCTIQTVRDTAASEMVYVSQYNNETTGRNENGYMYEVHNAKNGDEREIMLETGDPLTPGFYAMSTSADGLNALTFIDAYTGDNPDTRDNADGFYYYNFFYDTTLNAYNGSNIWTTGTVNNKSCPSSVPVVDARDAKQIAEDGVPEITSLNDVVALWSSQPDVAVSLDICYYSGGPRVSAIFVRGVGQAVVNAADVGALVYLTSDPRGGEAEAVVVAVSGDRKATLAVGDVLELNPEQLVLQDCSGSCWDNTKCNGFFSLEGATLENVILKHQRSLDSKGLIADHNIVTGWSDDDKVATFDYHTKQTDCGYYCYSNTKLTYTEAAYYLDLAGAADVDVVDVVDGSISTLAELKAAVQAAVAEPSTNNGIVISYYIPDAGNVPATIVVWAKDGNLTRSDNASQKLWQAWPGQTVYLPKGRSVGSSTELNGGAFSRRGATAWSLDGAEFGYLQSTCAYIPAASVPGFYTVGEMADNSYITLTYVESEQFTADQTTGLPEADTYFMGEELVDRQTLQAKLDGFADLTYITITLDGATTLAVVQETQNTPVGAVVRYNSSGAAVAAGSLAEMVTDAQSGDRLVITEDITIDERITVSGKSVAVEDDGTKHTISVTSANRAFSIDEGAELTIRANAGLTFEGGESGSVAFMVNGELNVQGDVTFKNFVCDNTTDTTGGSVIYVAGIGSATLDGASFSGNSTAKAGGAIYNNGLLSITDGAFTDNSSTNSGGAVYTSGTLEVDGTTFTGNSNPGTSGKFGGAIQVNGGTAILKDVTASGNSAYRGYDVYGASTANITVDGGSFTSGGNSTSAAALYIGTSNTMTIGGKVKAIINFQSTGAITVESDFSDQSEVNIWLAAYKTGRVLLSGNAAAIQAAVSAGAVTSTRAVEQGFTLGTDGKLKK